MSRKYEKAFFFLDVQNFLGNFDTQKRFAFFREKEKRLRKRSQKCFALLDPKTAKLFCGKTIIVEI